MEIGRVKTSKHVIDKGGLLSLGHVVRLINQALVSRSDLFLQRLQIFLNLFHLLFVELIFLLIRFGEPSVQVSDFRVQLGFNLSLLGLFVT